MMKTPGPLFLRARAGSLMLVTALFSACGGEGGGVVDPVTVASITTASAVPATLAAGSAVAAAPTVLVRGSDNQPFAGATVTFAVTGGGTISVPSATTNASGQASAGTWTVGSSLGANTLTATVNGMTAVFTVNAVAGAASQVTKQAGDNGSATVSTAVATRPAVRVADAFGNPVANATVTFAIPAGGGAITGATQVTNAAGIATVGSWTLGAAPGAYSVTATIPGGATVTFSATATAFVSPFNIVLRFSTPVPAVQEAAFQAAAARWMSIITSELDDVNVPAGVVTENACGITHPALAEVVDDIVIFVNLQTFDGPGGLLGQAGPCFVRLSNDLPLLGTMEFDIADMANMASNGSLTAVVVHEMGHVLGIGSLWSTKSLLTGGTGADPFFSGATAKTRFTQVGGTLSNGVPVENCAVGVPANCGAGTRDSHWREARFGTELMTGYLNAGANPLSVVTIASLQDLGYSVSFATADPYNIFSSLMTAGSETKPLMHINDRVLKPIGRIR